MFYQNNTYNMVYSYIYYRFGPAILASTIKPIVNVNGETFQVKNKLIPEAQREIFFYKDDSNIVLS